MAPSEPVETADGSLTLFSERYEQTFHSVHGARTESIHVFLNGAGVSERLERQMPTRVLEVGLGLGLNALVTAEAATQFGTNLDYVGIEHDLQATTVFRRILQSADLALVDQITDVVEKAHSNPDSSTGPIALNSSCSLSILRMALKSALERLDGDSSEGFDAIYLDAFSPDANPECWDSDTLLGLSRLLNPGGTLATYCAKGSVRRNLQATGLTVTRRPGPPGKRECLAAQA